MEYVVFHPAGDGSSGYRRNLSLPEAVSYVEHLRNVEEVTDVEVYALSAVPIALRPYYRVEIPAGYSDADADPPASWTAPAAEVPTSDVPAAGADPTRAAAGSELPDADAPGVGSDGDGDRAPDWTAPGGEPGLAGEAGPPGGGAPQVGGTPAVEPPRLADPLSAAPPADMATAGRRRGFGLFVP